MSITNPLSNIVRQEENGDALYVYADDLFSETVEFLEKHYKGLYAKGEYESIQRHVTVRPKAFALALKVIFGAVFASDIITVSANDIIDALNFRLGFDTSLITKEDELKINDILGSAGLLYKKTDSEFNIIFPYSPLIISSITPKLQRVIYKSLVKYILQEEE